MNNNGTPPVLEASVAYLARVQEALKGLPLGAVVELIELLLHARLEQRTVFIFGNGGSAATASHMASDLSKGTITEGLPRLRAFSLTDSVPVFTAWANDRDYTQVFSEQLRTLARPGDIAIAISGSGNSPNVLAGLNTAKSMEMTTVGLLGFDGGSAAGLVDLPIVVPADEYGPVEDIHLLLNHLVSTVMNQVSQNDNELLPVAGAVDELPHV